MKLHETITWIEQGTFETVITLTDDDGNVLEKRERIYDKTGSVGPAFDSLCRVIQKYHNVDIEVTTNHYVFSLELEEIKESSKKLARRLASILEQNEIEIKGVNYSDSDNDTVTNETMQQM